MDNRPIGICDSGVGGIVVLSEIIKLLPNESFIYLGDTGRFPYGTKSKDSIIKYTEESIEFLIGKNVKAIVVACGTASTVLPEILKTKYNLPIIGVLEPTLLQIDNNNKKIGIIATPRTIASKTWDLILKEKYPNREVIGKACPLLVPLAEAGWIDNEIAKLTLKEYLKPFKNIDISELILGCTHYPLFKKLIKQELEDVKLIDIGEKTAIYFKRFMTENKLLSGSNSNPKFEVNLTDMEDSYLEMINKLLNEKSKISYDDIKKVQL